MHMFKEKHVYENVCMFTQSPICGEDKYASDSKLYFLKVKISLMMYQLSSFFLPLFIFPSTEIYLDPFNHLGLLQQISGMNHNP